jgi:hypothetical protein
MMKQKGHRGFLQAEKAKAAQASHRRFHLFGQTARLRLRPLAQRVEGYATWQFAARQPKVATLGGVVPDSTGPQVAMEMSLVKPAGQYITHFTSDSYAEFSLEMKQRKFAGPLVPTHPIKSDKYACGPACVQEQVSPWFSEELPYLSE